MSSSSKNIRRSNRATPWVSRKFRTAQKRGLKIRALKTWSVKTLRCFKKIIRSVGLVSVGRWGERIAARYLEARGVHTIRRNWKASLLEADLIAYDGRELVIIEVKTRHASLESNFPAIDAITDKKRHHLSSLQKRLLHNNGPLCRRYNIRSVRVDVVEVYYQRFLGPYRRTTSVKWHKAFHVQSDKS